GVLLLGFIYFLIQIASYGLNFWAPDLIKAAGGGSPAAVGFLTAVPYICGAISMLVVGRFSDASGERPKFVAGLILRRRWGSLRPACPTRTLCCWSVRSPFSEAAWLQPSQPFGRFPPRYSPAPAPP